MKIWGNWGLGVTVFLILFVISNLVFLFVISSESFDMVEENYYDKGLNYQDKIDMTVRAGRLNNPLKLRISDINTIEFDYPDELIDEGISGSIYFYRPSDKSFDFKLEIKPDTNFKQYFNYSKIKRGIWVIKINFSSNDSTYYHEEEVVL